MSNSADSALNDGIRYLRGGSLDRALQCFESAAREASSPRVLSEALRRQADVKRRRAEWEEALALAKDAGRIAREHALRNEVAAALNIEGTIHLQQGAFDRAIETYRAALDAGPTPHQRGLICQNLGTSNAQQERYSEAAEWYARSSKAFGAAGYPREQLLTLVNQGSMRLDQGEFATAKSIFVDALQKVTELPSGDAELRAVVEINLAEALAREGDRLEEAFEYLLNATGHFTVSENRPHRVACHRVFALISEAQGQVDLAITALENGLRLAHEIGGGPEARHLERELQRLRTDYPTSQPDQGVPS